MASNIDLFFNTSRNKRTFPEVLAEIQEYLASKYSTLITDNPEEQHQQITCLLYTSPSPRDVEESRMPSSA